MSDIKKFLDLAGLTTYDGKIKEVISNETKPGKNADKALKTFLGDPTGYPDENIPLYSDTVNAAADAKAAAITAQNSASNSAAAAELSAQTAANILGTSADAADKNTVYGVYAKAAHKVDTGLLEITGEVEDGILTLSDKVSELSGNLDAYVTEEVKPAIDTYVNDTTKPAIDSYVNNTTKPAIDSYVDNTVKTNINDYVDGTAKSDINAYVNDTVKPTINDYVEDTAKPAIDNAKAAAIGAIDTYITTDATPAIDSYVDNTAKKAIDTYVNDTTKPVIDGYVDNTAKKAIDTYVDNTTKPAIDGYVDNTVKTNINDYVDNTAKPDIDDAKADAIGAINTYVDESVKIDINNYVDDTAKSDINAYVNDTVKPTINDYVEDTAKLAIDTYVTTDVTKDINDIRDAAVLEVNNALEPVTAAKNDATNAAAAADASAKAAADSANTATNAVTGFRAELGDRPSETSTVWDSITELKSATAGGVHFIGTTSQLPWEGVQNTTTGRSLDGGSTKEYSVGDIIIVASGGNEQGFEEPTKEYILAYGNEIDADVVHINGYRWVELGDVSPADQKITSLENSKLNKNALKGTEDTVSDLESNYTFAFVELTSDGHAVVRLDTIIDAIPTSDINALFA